MLEAKGSVGVAFGGASASEVFLCGFETQGRRHKNSKTGYYVPTKI